MFILFSCKAFLRDLENDISNHCFGYFKRLLISLLNANRSDAQADLNRAKKLAKVIFKHFLKLRYLLSFFKGTL